MYVRLLAHCNANSPWIDSFFGQFLLLSKFVVSLSKSCRKNFRRKKLPLQQRWQRKLTWLAHNHFICLSSCWCHNLLAMFSRVIENQTNSHQLSLVLLLVYLISSNLTITKWSGIVGKTTNWFVCLNKNLWLNWSYRSSSRLSWKAEFECRVATCKFSIRIVDSISAVTEKKK